MIDVEKMREARSLLDQVDALFADAGVYESESGLASAYTLKSLIDDLDDDIARAESGDLD